jgi:hypothetical protein
MSTTLERVTVNLTPRSSRALEIVMELTKDSKTDTICRALQVYAHIEQVIAHGGQVKTEDADGTEKILILM